MLRQREVETRAGDFLGLLKRVGSGLEDEEGEGDGVEESEKGGRCMLIWVIFFFTLGGFDGFCGGLSSPEESESESVASWSVRMIRRSFFRFWVLAVGLHGGSPSKWELAVDCLGWWSFSVDCTDMG